MRQLSFSTWLTVVMLTFFCVMVGLSLGFPAKARFMPLIVGVPGIILCLVQLAIDLFHSPKSAFHGAPRAGVSHDIPGVEAELPEFGPHTVPQEITMWTYLVSFVAGILVFGFYASALVLLLTFLRREAEASWKMTLSLAIGATIALYVAFGVLLRIQLFPGFFTPWLLKSIGLV